MLERKLRFRLERVERALEKIAQGTYGTCDVTGERIPGEHLERVPEEVETAEGRRRLLARGAVGYAADLESVEAGRER